MKPLVFTAFILLIHSCTAQLPVQLQLKKNERVKKRIETGTELYIKTKNGDIINALLLKIKTDSLYFVDRAVAVNDISFIKLPRHKQKMKFAWEEFAYVSLGVGLTTGGLILAGWQEFPEAMNTALIIGYSPYVFRFIKSISLKKRKFRLSGRYSLRIWDLRS